VHRKQSAHRATQRKARGFIKPLVLAQRIATNSPRLHLRPLACICARSPASVPAHLHLCPLAGSCSSSPGTIIESLDRKPILQPNFSPIPQEMLTKTMLHVSHYIKHTEGMGVHPAHIDYGRNYAINYIIETGGDKVNTFWTNDTKTEIVKEVVIEPRKWHVLQVNPVWHGVTGIKIGKLRSIISICLSPTDLENFNATEYFRSLL
jgi:hypothetical protein